MEINAGLSPVHYLLSRRNSSIASRIASCRSQFFLSAHRLIKASFPGLTSRRNEISMGGTAAHAAHILQY
jgi:hypothetical protein